MRMAAWRRVITVAVAKAQAMSSARPSPSGETLPVRESETITATPAMTAAMAMPVTRRSGSANSTREISAAISGTPACISRILATVVCCSATTKEVVAMVKQPATARPAAPMREKRARVPARPSRSSMKASRQRAAVPERQKIVAQALSISASRARIPPRLQTTAAPKTSQAPRGWLSDSAGSPWVGFACGSMDWVMQAGDYTLFAACDSTRSFCMARSRPR
jgi:hypothetical protein